MLKSIRIGSALLPFVLVAVSEANAQLPSASTAALGMGDNFTAVARGYDAIAWNPALLGVRGGPARSLALGQFRIVTGLAPVTLGDIAEFEGEVVSLDARRRWLERIEANNGESGAGGAAVTWLAGHIGRFGVQLSTTGHATAKLSPGAAELFLFGNAGYLDGEPRALDIDDSELRGSSITTAALAYGQPFVTPAGTLSLGATLKYGIGHFMIWGENHGSSITADPTIDLRFPVVSTDGGVNNGSGFGLDLGVAFARDRLTLAAALENVFNTFEWKGQNLVYRPGTALLDGNASETDFEERAFTSAPADLRARVHDARFNRVLRAGVAYDATDALTLSADIHNRFGEPDFTGEPDFHAGAGAQYRVAPFLQLRAGAAAITGGVMAGGGIGLRFGPVSLEASLARRGDQTIGMGRAALTF